MVQCLKYVLGLLCLTSVQCKRETWKSDLSSSMQIAVSYEGFSRAVVDCGEQEMAFVVTMDEDFEGAVYTRGSYNSKNSNCFRDAKGGKDFALKFAYNECGVKFDEGAGGHSTTVIVQFDDDLIFPGDLAFAITCARSSQPDGVDNDELPIKSRISLVAADPGAVTLEEGKTRVTAASTSEVATLYPPEPEPHKEL
ncbi:Zona pellucida domain [Trinorchestia longiramus]|nr:Zona pellucida domain [Trinorchestia longiramus]